MDRALQGFLASRILLGDWGDESITAPGHRLDESGRRGRVAEQLPEFVDDDVEAGVEVDKRLAWPERLLKRLARDQLAGPRHQHAENLPRLLL